MDGIKVTPEESELARSIVTAFASQAQQRFTPYAWQERIVRCLRVHTDLTETNHLAIITAAFRNPWWETKPDRPPTPP